MLNSISVEQIVQWHQKINVAPYTLLAQARADALKHYCTYLEQTDKQRAQLCVPPIIEWQELAYADLRMPLQKRNDAIFVGDVREFITSFPYEAEKYVLGVQQKNKTQLSVNACWNSFLVIFVPSHIRGAEIAVPQKAAQFLVQKILIVVQTGAQVKIRMSLTQNISMRAITCIVEDNAQLKIFTDDQITAHGCVDYTFLLDAHSVLEFFSDNSAAQSTHVALNIIARGRGAQATCRGLYILDEQQQIVVNSQQEHAAAETKTDILFKGILSGQSRAFFKGTIAVTEHGKKSSATLYNKNILASTQARAVSMPQLEVATNDVQCKHGSAISHIDKKQMLYLQSRGLDQHSAQTLLLASFVSDCIDVAYMPHVQKKLQIIMQEV